MLSKIAVDLALSILILILGAVLEELRRYVKRRTAESRYNAKLSIFIDAFNAVIPDFVELFADDGKLSDGDKSMLKKKVVAFALPKIRKLAGEALNDFKDWAEAQVEVALGEQLMTAGAMVEEEDFRESPVVTGIRPTDIAVEQE